MDRSNSGKWQPAKNSLICRSDQQLRRGLPSARTVRCLPRLIRMESFTSGRLRVDQSKENWNITMRHTRHHLALITLVLIVSALIWPQRSGQMWAAPSYMLAKVAAGLKFPDSVVDPPDSSGRLFVTELAATQPVIGHGVVGSHPFLCDLRQRHKRVVVS